MRVGKLVAETLKNLRPESKWTIDNGDYDTLDWRPENTTEKPTREEYEAEYSRLENLYNDSEYQRQRAPEYPPIGDQLDALFHAGVFPPEMAAQIQAVKDKYPKGS